MRTGRRTAAVMLAATVLVVAACGDDGNGSSATEQVADSGSAPEPAPAPGGNVAAVSADSEYGRILVDANGMTLYGFTNDASGQSSCTGTCASAWPPVAVGPNWEVGPELDSAIFNTHTRSDGGEQLVVSSWPLYTYSEDTVPGDTKGQGSGGVWFVVSAEDGTLIQTEPSGEGGASSDGPSEDEGATADVQVGETDLGEVLTDANGNTLYGFTNDADGHPTCADECAGTWPPLLVEGDPTWAEELDGSIFTTVDGAEGGTQVVVGLWPLYTFSGDGQPGDVNGHGSSGVWFAVAPDGTLIGAS